MQRVLLTGIAVSTITAAAFALLAQRFKQPPMLAYLLAGIVLGPAMGLGVIDDAEAIQGISEIGLVLLLYIIGLEIDVQKLAASGKALVVSGLFQFLLTLPLGLGFFLLLGFSLGDGAFDALYLAVAVGLSSTMIVVKLLYDKGELPTLPGRLTLGILVFQDIWAILFLAVQPNLHDPRLGVLAMSFGSGLALVGLSLLFTRLVLARLFRAIARVPELMLVTAVAWCFLVSGLAEAAGLSREMGALVAGVSLATLPYNMDVIAKVTNIRDFFVTLFFVGLGLQIPVPNPGLLGYALLGTLLLLATRLCVITPLLYWTGNGLRASLLPAINLAQISEFSLVIAALGLTLGHIDVRVLNILTCMFTITAVLSTYGIKYSHALQRRLTALLTRWGVRDIGAGQRDEDDQQADRPIVFLGFFREASSILYEMENLETADAPELTASTRVIDLSPLVYTAMAAKNIPCLYGDIASSDTLLHAHAHTARILVCSLPDSVLRGTTNMHLLCSLRQMCPGAFVIVTAETVPDALRLYDAGADFVFIPRIHAARDVAQCLADVHRGRRHAREQAVDALRQRVEVLP